MTTRPSTLSPVPSAAGSPPSALDSSLSAILSALQQQSRNADTDLLTITEIKQRLRCKDRYFYRHVRPHLHQFKPSKNWGQARYTRASLESYILSRIVDAHGHPVHKRAAKRKEARA